MTTDPDDVAAFYDDLSADYHRLFADWEASAARHGRAIDALVRGVLGPGPHVVLDCACGIGTQLVGLAPFGHRLHGTDLSPAAVDRARLECRDRSIEAELHPADLRDLPYPDAAVDVVLCVDNALPHLLTVDDVTAAFTEWARVLRPGGVALLTTRDYDAPALSRPTTTPVQRFSDAAGLRSVTTQLWDWSDDEPVYRLTHLQVVEQPDGSWRTRARTTRYRAWTGGALRSLAARAGLRPDPWLTAEQSGLHQQTLLLHRPNPPQP